MIPQTPGADPKSNPKPPQIPPGGPDWWLMMKAFLKQGRKIASVAPSSRFMARTIVNGINWDTTRCIVELGAGTGPITAETVKHVKSHTKVIVIELDPVLCGRLRARFAGSPNIDVVQGDATRFDELLAARGIDKVDHVISGLPLPSFPEELRNAVLDASSRTLAKGGTFRQLTVMPMVYYKLYRRYFDDVRFQFVPWNLPPGGVYVCRGYRSAGVETTA